MPKTSNNEQLVAAYALNLWTVSISQIIDYNDVNVMKQEYDTIMNNLNLEKMPKDEALLDVIKAIMDEITSFQIDDGDRIFVEQEYQHQLKNAVWSAIPNVATIFATSNPIAMGVTLATQVGIGYMNYRRNKAEYELKYDKAKWEIAKNRLMHLNALQKQLFETAWRLADAYKFPDEYRLTAQQITEYNKALMEPNAIKRYNSLKVMAHVFEAYPVYWYQLGSTANSVFRSEVYAEDPDIKDRYKAFAIEAFEKYSTLNNFNLLRHDVLTSAWALEYLELLELNENNNPEKAKELIKLAEDFSGNALDIAELCAFAYLRIADRENAIRLFHFLVNAGYNSELNTQILSGLYIKEMRSRDEGKVSEAKVGYRELRNITDPKYIIPIPDDSVDLKDWKPEWNREESFEEFIADRTEQKKQAQRENEEARKKARIFYQKPTLVVYNPSEEDVAEYFLGVLNENRNRIGENLPSPSRMSLKEYKRNRVEIEQKSMHVILLGDSDEAKRVHKCANNGAWDYDKLGMFYVTFGQKTVIMTNPLKNREINDFVALAQDVNKRHPIMIPHGVETVTSFFEEILDIYKKNDASIPVAIIASIIVSPLLVLGAGIKGVLNAFQAGTNIYSMKDINFTRYSITIYEYLESENALIEQADND